MGSASANSVVAKLLKYLNDYILGRFNWSFYVDVCTDEATAITRVLSGLTTRINEVAFKYESLHCVIEKFWRA